MDFFEAQDRARRKTALLVVYFVTAVVLMVAALYLAAVLVVTATAPKAQGPSVDWIQPEIFLVVAGTILLIITCGSLYKTAELRAGGAAVAMMLGGRRIPPETTELGERQVLNVVEEIAIASGVAVPPVYVMEGEKSINAFAAGFTPGDAVIGVSRGSLDYLSRDELQGVIAHEFSHILNGDMRFNLRLIGILHGILLIAIVGYYALRVSAVSGGSRRSGKDGGGAQIMLLGFAALVVGSIGLLFGRLIKAAVSRQREYLADASAVQFTRNPGGIAGALKKIGGLAQGSYVKSPEAETASHMFFGSAFRRFAHSPFATHPPLTDRIRCIDSAFDGKFPPVAPLAKSRERKPPVRRKGAAGARRRPLAILGGERRFPIDPAVIIAAVGAPTTDHMDYSRRFLEEMPEELARGARDTFTARGILFALLLDENDAIRQQQLELVESREGGTTRRETERLAGPVAQLDRSEWLPLIGLLQNSLRELSPEQYDRFRDTILKLVAADRKLSLFEFVLQRVLLKHLDRAFERTKPPAVTRYSISAVFPQSVTLLSALALVGQSNRDEAARVFQQSLALLETGKRHELLDPKDCSLSKIGEALDTLAQSTGVVKKRVLRAATACVMADRKVTVGEAELLRAVADSLDCPMPPLVAGELGQGEQPTSP